MKVLGLRGPAGSPVEEDRRVFQEQIGVLVEGAVIGVRIENERNRLVSRALLT